MRDGYDDFDRELGRVRRRPFVVGAALLVVVVALVATAYFFRGKSPTLRRFFASVSLPWESPCERLEKRCGSDKEHVVNIKPSHWVCAGIALRTFFRSLETTTTLSSDQCAAALVVMERVDEEGLDALDRILEEEGVARSLGKKAGQLGAKGAPSGSEEPAPIGLHATGRWRKHESGGRGLKLEVSLSSESDSEVLEWLTCKADLTVTFPDKPEQDFMVSRSCPVHVLKPREAAPADGTWEVWLEEKWLLYAPNGASLTIELGAQTPFGVHYAPLVLSGQIPGPMEDGSFEFGSDTEEDVWPSKSKEQTEEGQSREVRAMEETR